MALLRNILLLLCLVSWTDGQTASEYCDSEDPDSMLGLLREINSNVLDIKSNSLKAPNAECSAYCQLVHKSSCFKLETRRMNWHNAVSNCAVQGARLAEVTNGYVNGMIKNICKDTGLRVWIGASDEAEEGDWKWVTSGRQVQFQDWIPGFLDNAGGRENCAHIGSVDGSIVGWNDVPCQELMFMSICEFQMP